MSWFMNKSLKLLKNLVGSVLSLFLMATLPTWWLLLFLRIKSFMFNSVILTPRTLCPRFNLQSMNPSTLMIKALSAMNTGCSFQSMRTWENQFWKKLMIPCYLSTLEVPRCTWISKQCIGGLDWNWTVPSMFLSVMFAVVWKRCIRKQEVFSSLSILLNGIWKKLKWTS